MEPAQAGFVCVAATSVAGVQDMCIVSFYFCLVVLAIATDVK
ncbi:hypothetical protein [Nostoc sp. FACHB-110]|nr:hypothetical protein [Nostoc sp. FACHB-110]